MTEGNRFERIKKAVEERDAFLKEHPELQSLQDEIEEVLNKAGDDKFNRQRCLQEFMLETWFKITKV